MKKKLYSVTIEPTLSIQFTLKARNAKHAKRLAYDSWVQGGNVGWDSYGCDESVRFEVLDHGFMQVPNEPELIV